MTIKDQLRTDMTAAMKAKDTETLRTLRMVLAAIGSAEVAGDTRTELDDDQVLAVLASEAKRRVEAADAFAAGGRDEQAAAERAEGEVIARYLPAALSADELDALVAEEVASAAAAGQSGPKAMGAVIKAVRARAGATADGAAIAAAVKASLAG
jgi:uncharacterized protein YqeY